jgi:hypothetical protein
MMSMVPIRVVAAATLLFSLLLGSGANAASETIISGGDASRLVGLTEVKVNDGAVSGVLVNKSPHPIREVELLIDHAWLWSDERHPGADNPSRSAYYTVHSEIPPGGTMQFTYQASPPLPRRTDGHFETSMQIVGLVEVGK